MRRESCVRTRSLTLRPRSAICRCASALSPASPPTRFRYASFGSWKGLRRSAEPRYEMQGPPSQPEPRPAYMNQLSRPSGLSSRPMRWSMDSPAASLLPPAPFTVGPRPVRHWSAPRACPSP